MGQSRQLRNAPARRAPEPYAPPIASTLTAAGYHTGLYTSPHLIRFTERIRIDEEEIPEADLAALVEQLKPHVAQVPGLTIHGRAVT